MSDEFRALYDSADDIPETVTLEGVRRLVVMVVAIEDRGGLAHRTTICTCSEWIACRGDASPERTTWRARKRSVSRGGPGWDATACAITDVCCSSQ